MPTYAKETDVPSERTRNEIERTLRRYGATGFGYMWEDNRALIAFKLAERQIRFLLPLPDRNAPEIQFARVNQSNVRQRRTPAQVEVAWEQAQRQRWRALLLVIKAKLEAVEAGITTIEDEFLAHVALPDGRTVGQWLKPQLERALGEGRMPPMLPPMLPPPPDDEPAP